MKRDVHLVALAGALVVLGACNPEKPKRPVNTEDPKCEGVMQGGVCKPFNTSGDQKRAESSCSGSGGAWNRNTASCECTLPQKLNDYGRCAEPVAVSENSGAAQEACKTSGGIWNPEVTPSCECKSPLTLSDKNTCIDPAISQVPENPALAERKAACTAAASGGTWKETAQVCDCGTKKINATTGACESATSPVQPTQPTESTRPTDPAATSLQTFKALQATFLIAADGTGKNCIFSKDKIITVTGEPKAFAGNDQQKVVEVSKTDSACAVGPWNFISSHFIAVPTAR